MSITVGLFLEGDFCSVPSLNNSSDGNFFHQKWYLMNTTKHKYFFLVR
jgi:hypothetical protein